MLVTSIFSFSHNIFYPSQFQFQFLSHIFFFFSSANAFNLDQSKYLLFGKELTHSLIHHFETVPNSKKLQTTTETLLLQDFKIQTAWKTLWKKVKLLILSNFTFFHNVFLKLFSSMCYHEFMEERVKLYPLITLITPSHNAHNSPIADNQHFLLSTK